MSKSDVSKKDVSKKGNDLLKITLVKSTIGVPEKLKRVVKALGLRKTNSSVVKKVDPAVRGMIFKVSHLVKVEKAAE